MPNIQFQFRRGTASQWTSANPVLASGELGLETDTSQFKMGNGSTAWNSLPYGGIQGPTGNTGLPGTSNQALTTLTYAANINIPAGTGEAFIITATGNPTITISGTPAAEILRTVTLIFVHSGAPRTITWSGSNIKFTDNTAPILSTVAGAVDVLTFFTYDQGVTWNGGITWWSNT
jgi:hypothetical protein